MPFFIHAPESLQFIFSLQHSGLAQFDVIRVENRSSCAEDDVALTLAIPGWSDSISHTIPRIAAGATEVVRGISPLLNFQRICTLNERTEAALQISVNGKCSTIPVEILAYNEWSTRTEHAASLAAFAQPNNSAIHHINRRIGGSNATAEDIYGQIARLKLHYGGEATSFEDTSQKIRFHDEVLSSGVATCIDLAMLICGLMESHGRHAVVLLVRTADSLLHALVGTWNRQVSQVKAVIDDLDEGWLNRLIHGGELTVLDPVGVASPTHPSRNLVGFDESTKTANHLFRECEFVVGVDIGACRMKRIQPLPSMSVPHQTGQVFEILRRARERALRGEDRVVSTAHLFAAMLDFEGGIVRKVIASATGKRIFDALTVAVDSILSNQPRGSGLDLRESGNLRIVRLLAREIAQQMQELYVTESHVFAAFLVHPGNAGRAILDHLLHECGISPDDMKARLRSFSPIDFEWVESRSRA